MTSFKYFRVVRIEKQIRFVFCEKFTARQFYFQIYWPLALVYLIPSLPGLGRNRVFGACCSLPKRPINRFKPVLVKGDNRRFRAYCPKKIYCSKISGFCYGLFRMLKFLSFREWSKKFRFSVKNQSLKQKMMEAKKL